MRKIDLVSYLPPFMAEYREIAATLKAEESEFSLAGKAIDQILQNEFIVTADIDGVSRFERMLHIYPSDTDLLEDRRSRVLAKYNENIPYTKMGLEEILTVLCGKNEYQVRIHPENYSMEIRISLRAKKQLGSVKETLIRILPCNIMFSVVLIYNTWGDLTRFTWKELSKNTWKELKEEVL